ncbi:MAG: MBL fold metallo-hydrolase [Clostridia bacterium]|nr:MBL fold metallo-hydrolase [Clostridia bacterium]
MMAAVDQFYTVERIHADTYRIDENGAANCYLVIGSEKALLIDTCWGAGDLNECVRRLTDKPVTVAVTHRHPDHTGGARQFGDFYAHEQDNTRFNRLLEHPLLNRLAILRSGGKAQKSKKIKALPLKHGDVFDLGGRRIEVRSVPGHTAGSVMFIDHEAKLLFTGDNVNPHLWMHRPGAVTLEEWMDSAKLILGYMEQGYTAHTGHGDGTQSKENVEIICRYVQEIIDKQGCGQLSKNDSPYPEKGGEIEIQFNIHRITRK